jgi:protein-disulfide isomerase
MFGSRRLLIALLPLVLIAGLAACKDDGTKGAARSSAEREDDMAIGNPKAPIVMFEYASLTCPHCAEFHKDVFPALKEKYIDTGKMRFIFRQLPTPPVPFAVGAEAVARCAGPQKYFELLDILYEKQRYWIRSNNPRKALMEMAATAGITQSDFDACVSDETNIARIKEVSIIANDEYGIIGTPSFVINGKTRPHSTGRPYVLEDFVTIIDPMVSAESNQKGNPDTDS